MHIDKKQVFNLWDTNGRRSDVLNALSIYIRILKELEEEYPGEKWASYPDSILQYKFYEKAIEASPEVFGKHDKYDEFMDLLKSYNMDFNLKNEDWFNNKNYSKIRRILDEAIESRARHYTSNLVRLGFATDKRKITPCGNVFLSGNIKRDNFEKLLPINNTNLILLRQLMKLKIFGKSYGGLRRYYSPFYMAMYLLLTNDRIDKNVFINIVQGLNPYIGSDNIKKFKNGDFSLEEIEQLSLNFDYEIPEIFKLETIIPNNEFSKFITNRKSRKTEPVYYEFYSKLYNFYYNRNESNYEELRCVYHISKDKINKAFCYGKTLFNFGINCTFSYEKFIEENNDNIFLNCPNINKFFYESYEKSKHIDIISEYSDTTMRILGATGIIKTKSALIELSYKSILLGIFPIEELRQKIFGAMSDDEFYDYEKVEDSIFGNVDSMTQIMNISNRDRDVIVDNLKSVYNVKTMDDLVVCLDNEVNNNFNRYIKENYPINKVVEILSLFSDRKNDRKIKREVNESADVPTIYEYIVGIAWYYISGNDFNLYDSLNLTLNANFEPESHAGGGMGDIVIDYPDKSVMLEVTLMNKNAQKRGEWEPVLRHSINNKVEKLPKNSITFFIADELDYNTINIWRAVSAVPLESSTGSEKVDGVVIMPFKTSEIIYFLNNSINSDLIIEETKKSYAKINKITDDCWRNEIMEKLI